MSKIARTRSGHVQVAPDTPSFGTWSSGAPTAVVLLDESDSSWRALNRALLESPCASSVRPVLFQQRRWFEGVCSLVVTDVSVGVTLEALRREILVEYRDMLPLRGVRGLRVVETRRAVFAAIGAEPLTRVFANRRMARVIRAGAARRGLDVVVVD